MTNRTKIILGAVVVFLVVIGVYSMTHVGPKALVQGVGEPSGFDNVSLTGGLKVGVAAGDTSIPANGDGSITASGIYTNTFASSTINGVSYQVNRVAATLASTTRGAVQCPTSTSTLVWASYLPTTSTSTQTVFTIAKATTAFATSTALGTTTIAANALGVALGATTTPVADTTVGRLTQTDRTCGPSNWITVGESGGQGPFNEPGIFTVVLQTLN